MVFETLTVHRDGGALFVNIAAPPMNLKRGFQTREGEMALGRLLGDLAGRGQRYDDET
jgi:hypothetical protein